MLVLRIITAATAISDGYDLGVVNGVAMILAKEPHLYTKATISCFVAIMAVFVGIGAFLGGYCSDLLGRKATLCGSYILLIVGPLLMLFAQSSLAFLLVGRSVAGLGIGIGGVVGTVYMAELSPTKSRGSLVTQEALFLSVGLLLGYLSNYALLDVSSATFNDFNFMLGAGAFLPLLCLCGLFFAWKRLPESPYFERISTQTLSTSVFEKFHDFLNCPGSRSALLVGLLQPFCGVGPILYFSDLTFQNHPGESTVAITGYAVWIGVTKVSVLCVSTFILMDRINRVTLLLTSSFFLIMAMGFIGVLFLNNVNDGLLLGAFCCAVGGYAIGWNGVPVVYPSELLPTRTRTFGIAFITIMGRIVSVGNSFMYPLVGLDNSAIWFFVFCGFNCVSFVCVYVYAKETLNKPLLNEHDDERIEILNHTDEI